MSNTFIMKRCSSCREMRRDVTPTGKCHSCDSVNRPKRNGGGNIAKRKNRLMAIGRGLYANDYKESDDDD